MAINVKTPQSPGWWLQKAFVKRDLRLPRLQELALWQDGNPPAPKAVQVAREAFQEFEEEAVTNFAELITGSVRERMSVREIRTAVSGSDLDDVAWLYWLNNNLDVEMPSIIETMLWAGDSYALVGKDPDTGEVTVTSEDPRDVVTFHNPARQSQIRCGVKFLRDREEARDYAIVTIAGGIDKQTGQPYNARTFVAYRDIDGDGFPEFSEEAWSWDEDQGGAEGLELNHRLVPFVRFRNRNGKGEFEPHLKILRRINRFVFQLTVIAMYQAFKQRAVIVDEDEDEVRVQDAFKQEIGLEDLDDALTSDPGSWFLLPRGAKIWESTQADVQGILSAIKDDVMRLAAVTRRPMAIFAPDNQAAEGANFTREGLTFAVEDKITRATQGIVDMYYLIFLTAGDVERAQKPKIIVGWKPTERYSLTDMASATSQVAGTMPKRTIYREIWQKTPAEIMQIESEAADELLLNEQILPPAAVPAPARQTPAIPAAQQPALPAPAQTAASNPVSGAFDSSTTRA